MECDNSAPTVTAHVAAIKEKFPLARVALLGHYWAMSEITAAFQAGANAYFAEATASDEFIKAIGLIMMAHSAVLPIGPTPRAFCRPEGTDGSQPIDGHGWPHREYG